MQIGTYDIGRVKEGVKYAPMATDKSSGAPSVQRPGNVPCMSGYQSDIANLHAQSLGGHPIGLGRRFETAYAVGRKHLLKEVADARVPELGFGHLLC